MLHPPESAAATASASDPITEPARGRGGDAADRPIGAEHRNLAERQVDPSDQPIDQRIGGREQRIDRRKRHRVDQLLQRVGHRCRDLRCLRHGGRHHVAPGLGEIPLEEREPHLADRSRLGLGRHQVEPVGLERGAAEATGEAMHAPRGITLAHRVVDAHAGAGERRGRDADLADLGALRMQHRQDQAAQPHLLGIGHPGAAASEQGDKQRSETEPNHCPTIR
jgi:hypothetical protein